VSALDDLIEIVEWLTEQKMIAPPSRIDEALKRLRRHTPPVKQEDPDRE
jgi:hypothetical protein